MTDFWHHLSSSKNWTGGPPNSPYIADFKLKVSNFYAKLKLFFVSVMQGAHFYSTFNHAF